MTSQHRIERLMELTNEHIDGLADVLIACVEGGLRSASCLR